MRLMIAVLAGLIAVTGHTRAAASGGHDHARHGAHVHGQAELLVALDGRHLEIAFSSPAMNLVGFEHAPSTSDQVAAVRRAAALLGEPAALFGIPLEAGCVLQESDIDGALLEDEAHAHDDHAHEARGHADFHAGYRFECERPGRLHALNVTLFEAFSGVHALRAVVVTDRSQQAGELTAQHPRLPLRPGS